jgi:6-phosphogluconolactonase
MSITNLRWSRRTFIAAAGLTAADSMVSRLAVAEHRVTPFAHSSASFLAYVGFAPSGDSASDRIECYRVEGGRWASLGEPLAHQAPRAFVLHPTLPVLYAVHNNADYINLPRGSVSAYGIGPSGRLALASRQPLSLSATHPEHVAISPDGSAMLISSAGGGAYNLLSVSLDGALLPSPYALKQTGSGPHPLQARSRPQAVLFHPSGATAYAADLGADRVSQLTVGNGRMTVASRASLAPGTGPAHIALHPNGDFIVVSSRLSPSLTVLPVSQRTGKPVMPSQKISVDAGTSGPLAINRRGDRVYATARGSSGESSVSTYAFSAGTGTLRPMTRMHVGAIGSVEHIALLEDQLLLAGANGIASLPIDRRSGVLGDASLVVERPGAVAIALRML